jgi:AcrR family transcriptional regulator
MKIETPTCIEPGRPRRQRNARGEGGRLRDELIGAALEVIAQEGSADAATIRAVARRAGVSAPSVYLHFADRDALLAAVVVRLFDDLTDTVDGALDGLDPATSPAGALRAGCRAYIDFGLDNPGHYRLLFDEPVKLSDEEAALASHDALGTLVDGIASCQAAGAARDGDPFTMAVTIWSALHGIVMSAISGRGFPEPDVDTMLELVLSGMTGVTFG